MTGLPKHKRVVYVNCGGLPWDYPRIMRPCGQHSSMRGARARSRVRSIGSSNSSAKCMVVRTSTCCGNVCCTVLAPDQQNVGRAVLVTPRLTDIEAPRRPIFARWERMHGAPIGYEVRK